MVDFLGDVVQWAVTFSESISRIRHDFHRGYMYFVR